MESTRPSVFVKNYEEGITTVKRGGYAFLMESTVLDYVVQVNAFSLSQQKKNLFSTQNTFPRVITMHLHFDAPFSMLKKGLLGAFASRILIFKSPHLNFWVTQNVN